MAATPTCTLRMTGVKEIMQAMNKLPDRIYRKVLRSALLKGATVQIKAARRLCPKGETGMLRKSIGRVVKKDIRAQRMTAIVGPIAGPKFNYAGNVSHLVEFGHRQVVGGTVKRLGGGVGGLSKRTGHRETGKVVGMVAPQPFLRPAFDATKWEAQKRIRDGLGVGIERETRKLAKLK